MNSQRPTLTEALANLFKYMKYSETSRFPIPNEEPQNWRRALLEVLGALLVLLFGLFENGVLN